jgi:Zn-finger protein
MSWTPDMKKNGYLEPPVLNTSDEECYICGFGGDLAVHEIYYGRKNRGMSKRHGCYVWLCPSCHRLIHEKPDNGRTDRRLKRECQQAVIEKLNSENHDGRKIFMAWFGRYYD